MTGIEIREKHPKFECVSHCMHACSGAVLGVCSERRIFPYGLLCVRGSEAEHWWISWIVCHCASWKISRCCVICPLAAQIQQKDYSHIYYDIFHDGKLRAHVVCWAQPGQVFLWGTQWDVSRYHQILHSYRCLSSASTVPFIMNNIIKGVPIGHPVSLPTKRIF